MDFNIVVISGRLAAEPEIRIFDGGATVVRFLVAAHTDTPRRRIDVVPVVLWDAGENATEFERGDRVWVAGSVQRRFWSDDRNRRSRIEVVAHHVQKREDGQVVDVRSELLSKVGPTMSA
jgi:single-stranded DNA-binding protein